MRNIPDFSMVGQPFYTYLHCKPDGTPFYVGKGSGRRRYRDFKWMRNQHYKNIIAKFGAENIRVFVFPCASEEEAFADEKLQIAQLRRDGFALCNQSEGGDGSANPAPEVRLKMSLAKVGRKLTEEHKYNISKASKGKVISAETGRRISEAKKKKGFKHSPEAIEKMSQARKLYYKQRNSIKEIQNVLSR